MARSNVDVAAYKAAVVPEFTEPVPPVDIKPVDKVKGDKS